jgi:T5SS/PEP-CTERM-associated repeat protein
MIDSEYFGAIGVGYSGIGSLVIKDSMAVLSNGGYLGYQPGSSGTATVAGSGSVWNNRQSLYIGFEGTGMLSIEGGGGAVSRLGYLGHSNGSNGTVTVTGAGSTWNNSNRLSVGYYGAGTLNVENGGTVNSDQIAYLGQYEGASGNANIIGTGSAWNNTEDLYVGYSGNGSLSIKDGGLVNNLKGSLAYNIGANATVSVEGAGSVWNNSGSFAVARYGTGILNIKNGGTVNNEASSMGSAEGAIGIVTVTGSDSLWNNTGRMIIGVGGAGTLNIENGGMVSISNGMKIASSAGSSGTVNLSRGTLDMNGSNIVAGEGMVVFNFTAGVIKDATNIDLKKRFVQSGGILAPGGSIGQTDIVGDYDLTAGTLELELGGLGNPVDLVTATGDIDISILGTILDLRALGSMAAGTYTVLESTRGTITGMFESVSAFNLFGVNATVLNTGTAITVTLDSDLVFADPNTDGFVGIEDLNILLANWNQTVTPGDILAGDLNGDGFVGIEDLNAILGNWNAGAPPPPPDVSAATPEPGTISVLAISAVWGGARRRTRRL